MEFASKRLILQGNCIRIQRSYIEIDLIVWIFFDDIIVYFKYVCNLR